MKRIISIISILCFAFATTNAQPPSAYEQAMYEALPTLGAETVEARQAGIDQFDQIAEASDGEWIPGYYTVLSRLLAAFGTEEEDPREALLDEAQERLDALLESHKAQSELWVLQGMIYQGRLQTSPMLRGPVYSPKAVAAFERAEELDPSNPRAWLQHGMQLYHTPKFFGGGQEAACPYFTKASQKFANATSDEAFYPDWGADRLQALSQGCEQ